MPDRKEGFIGQSETRIPISRGDAVWFATAIAALALVLLLAFINWRGVDAANTRATQARGQVATLRRILRLVDDAETGQRGYLLTGGERYLKPYKEALTGLPKEVSALKQRLSSTPYSADFVGIEADVQKKLAEIAQTVKIRRYYGLAAALAVVQTDTGQTTMEDIRSAVASLEQKIAAEANMRTSEVAERARDAALITSAACITLFVLLALANLQLRRQRAVAESANRAKSAFLASMSHELRTPLNAIIGYSEMLAEEMADTGQEMLTNDLNKIRSAGKHLLLLINSVLDLSKIEAGKMDLYIETVSISAVAQEVASVIQPLADKNQNRLEVKLDPRLGTIQVDQTKLRQTLYNLLSNACKFTQKGVITLSIGPEKHSARDGHGDEMIAFQVTDTGIGMTSPQVAKLFKPFSQADSSTTRKFGGTGLGLALSQRFVTMMKGEILVESKPGDGSTFTVRLPVRAPGQVADQQLAAIEASTGEDIILTIDDEPLVQDLLSRTLSKYGFRVYSASTGEEGIRLARKLRPAAITLDVMMPGMDGWMVLSKLKADPELANIPVVMLTIADNRNLGYTLGATDYLAKPIDREQLIPVLMRYRAAVAVPSALVVEDDVDSRLLMKRVLEAEGWKVLEAENGRTALTLIAKTRPGIIVLDLMMPEMDGFEFVPELRRTPEGKDIPIIVVTAKDLTSEERLRLNGQVSRVLQKGAFQMEDLLPEVGRLVVSRVEMRRQSEGANQ